MSTNTLSPAAFETGTVRSSDGTDIGYRRIGHGPSLILVHGAMMTSHLFEGLARALAADFTVYAPDRRGRGLSGPLGPRPGIEAEVDDLAALMREADAHNVFGLSSGAVIALNAAAALPSITKLAVYEPPLAIDGESPTAWTARYERELARGRTAAAVVEVLKGSADAGSFAALPRWVLVPLMALAMRVDKGGDGMPPLRDLAPTAHYDFEVVRAVEDRWDIYADLHCDMLLLGGSKSIGYLRTALDRLHSALPDATRVVLPGVGHTASFTDESPELAAAELRRFFR